MDSVYFRSRFWKSATVRTLKPTEKLFYAYLITNEETKPSGIYKFCKDDCMFWTGLNIQQIDKAFENLRNKEKVYYFKDWIFIVTFLRETFNLDRKILSGTIKKAIEKQFSNTKIPVQLIACFNYFYDTLSIPYPYPIDTLRYYIEIRDLRLEIKKKKEIKEKKEKKEKLSSYISQVSIIQGDEKKSPDLTPPPSTGKRPESSSNPKLPGQRPESSSNPEEVRAVEGYDPITRKFLAIVGKYPGEFKLKRKEDAQWLKDRVLEEPQFKSLDLGYELDGWDTWLETQYRRKEDQFGRKLEKRERKHSFPISDFKRSLTNRLKKSLKWQQEKRDGENNKSPGKGPSECTKQAKPEFG